MRHRLRAALAAALAFALPALVGADGVRSAFPGADPFALFADGRMWVYPTGRGEALASWSSADLRHWQHGADLLRLGAISWASADGAPRHFLWAPDMLRAHGQWLLYYSIGPQDPTPSRLGVATCTGPAGPCTDSGRPLLTGGHGFEAIDPMVFVDPRSGTPYLYAGGSAGARLRAFELAPDLETIAREVPVDQPPDFTEGVFMHERRGIYYLSYSHGHWNRSDYRVEYATAPSPTGPWTYRGVILQGDQRFKGPGHHSFVEDPRTGRWFIVYHRWEDQPGNGPYVGARRVAIQPITYTPDGLIEPVRMSD